MKKAMSLFVVFSLILPLVLVPVGAKGEDELPPWVEEGEIWHPAGEIMLFEDDGCPKNHFAPKGYTYQGYTEGNTLAEAIVQTAMVKLVAWIPGLGQIASIIDTVTTIEWIKNGIEEGRLRTNYFKYVYTNGNLYWHHYYWYYYNQEGGYLCYLSCEVNTNVT